MLNRITDAMRGRRSGSEDRASPLIPDEESPDNVRGQWYEVAPDLLAAECNALDERGLSYECSILPDARLCIACEIEGRKIGVVCSYIHPLQPPEVLVLSSSGSDEIASEDGGVDLFAHNGFTWDSRKNIADVVARVELLFGIYASVKRSEKEE